MTRHDKAKLVIFSNSCPALRKSGIESYTVSAKSGVHGNSGNNTELGTAWGKCYRPCTLAVIDPGEPGIIRSMPQHTGEKQIMQNYSLIKLARACLKKKEIKFKFLVYTRIDVNRDRVYSNFLCTFYVVYVTCFRGLTFHRNWVCQASEITISYKLDNTASVLLFMMSKG